MNKETNDSYFLSSNAFDLPGNLTLEAWVFPIGNQAANGSIIAKNDHSGSPGSHNYTLDLQATNFPRLQVNISPNNNQFAVATSALTLSVWTHIVAVRDSTNLFMYINGVLDNTTAGIPAGALTDPSQIFTIGSNSTGNFGYAGRLDEVAVYNFALSPARVLAHYNARNLPG